MSWPSASAFATAVIKMRACRDFPKICLIRHGETAWTISGQHTGRTDIPLTDRGERDAQELLLFAHRDILRVLAARWLGLAAREGGYFYLATGVGEFAGLSP